MDEGKLVLTLPYYICNEGELELIFPRVIHEGGMLAIKHLSQISSNSPLLHM